MKRMVLNALCTGLFIAMLAGCGRNDGSASSVSAVEPEPAPASVSEPESSLADEVLPSAEDAEETEISADHILMQIEAAYGEDYPADALIPQEMLESQFGLKPELYEEAKGVMASISVNNDQVVVVKAAPGKADEVEEALQQARQKKIDDTLQYPMNIPKTNASKVVRHEDFVAFLLVGVPNDGIEDIESAEAKQYAEDQVTIAVNAFNSVFA